MFAFWRDRVPVFWQNFLAGLVIVGLLISFDRTPFVKSWEDWAVDIMIRLNSTLERMTGFRQKRDDLQFTLLDMDEMSYRSPAWNEPYRVPRDKLLKLIDFAVKGRASLIAVDVDLSVMGNDPNSEATAALRDYLLAYPMSAPPLILMRSKQNKLGDSASDFGEFRQTILGDVQKPNVFFAQPLFKRDTKDSVVRRWILFEPGCENGQGVAMPSVQLLAYALLKDRREGTRRNLEDLLASLAANRPLGCDSGRIVPVNRPIIIGNVVFKQQDRGERLIYTMPWPKTGRSSPDLRTIPALFISDRGYSNTDEVTNRITVIGASYAASGDWHETPLGYMPGVMVILNAIKSLSMFDQISQPPLMLRVPLLLAFVILISAVFSRYNSFIKIFIVTAMAIIVFVPISFWFFKYGIWFDFGILLLAIKLQHSLNEYLETRELKKLKQNAVEKNAWEDIKSFYLPSRWGRKPDEAAEMHLSVELKRQADGSYLVNATAPEGDTSTFSLAPGAVEMAGNAYRVELQKTEPPTF